MPRIFRSLPSNLRSTINAALNKAGLDGNTYFAKSSAGFVRAVEILAKFGIELDEVVSSHLFSGARGRMAVDLAFTNPEDSFSPISISNSMLTLSFHEMESGQFEVIAYLS